MEVSVENTGSLERRVKISVPEDKVEGKCESKMAELAKQVNIKGFRQGKVPKKVMQQRFGKSVRAEVIGEVIQDSLQEALKDNELNPAGMPKIDDIKDESGQPLEYVATFEIYPSIELADLSSESIDKKVVDVTEADVQKTIQELSENQAKFDEVDRKSKLTDKLEMDLEREWVEGDDESEEPQKFSNIEFNLDDKKSLPELVEQLVGKKAGEESSCEIAYPEEWHDKKLAGKKAKFNVTVHKVLERKALSESELAESMDLDKDDIDGLKAKIKERLEKESEKSLKEAFKEKVLEVLLEKNSIEMPKSLFEQERKALVEEMTQRGEQDSADEKEIDEMAEKRVLLGLLVNEIIAKHEVKVDNQLVREYIAEQAANFPDPKRFISYYYTNKELLQGVERMVLLEQAVDVIAGTMKVNEIKITLDDAMKPEAE